MVEITAAEQNIERRMKRNEVGLRNPLGQHQMHQHSHHSSPRRRRTWQPTPVFLPGESQGQWSLVGCRLWGHRVGHD